MKKSKGYLFIAWIYCLGMILLLPTQGLGEDQVLAKKTLKRWPDPVVMKGTLAKAVLGKQIANLRVYAYRNGSLDPIRYQIDELTGENGDWVFTDGPIPNKELANGKFDSWDKLAFMASDTGDRVTKGLWTPGCTLGEEIEVIDPLTGEKGWCYLLYFASNPPSRSSEPDYITYNYTASSCDTDYYHTDWIISPDGRHSTFYKACYLKELAGGNNKSWPDRLKTRAEVKFLFSLVAIRMNEESTKSNVMAYKQGPVKLIVRSEQYSEWHGRKVFRLIGDNESYRNMAFVPLIAQFIVKLDTVLSSAIIRFTTDYSPNVLGSKTCLSSDPTHWYQVNGKMDENEKNFNPATFDKWRLMTGDWGTLMFTTIFPPEMLPHVKIDRGIIDDTTHLDPPETYPGCIGMAYQDWHVEKVPRGTYFIFANWYFPINYKPGDEVMYENITDHFLKIRVGENTGENQLLTKITNICKKHK